VSSPAPGLEQPATLTALIEAQGGAALSIDDVLVLVLPLFEDVASLHAKGHVAVLDPGQILLGSSGALRLRDAEGQRPAMDIDAVHRVQPHPASALNIVGELRRAHGADGVERLEDTQVQADPTAPIERPVYLPGFRSWEIELGHHDEITDIFRLGQVLAALACGLNFEDMADVESFAAHRRNLFHIAPRLNPIVASVIAEMTAINRHDRATDLESLSTRLRTWREQPQALDVARALASVTGAVPRRTAVLSHLRDRLFDLSRRNRLLYFRPGASSVNLTVSSVPLMLQIESIRPEHICTWGGPFAEEVVAGRLVDLHRWLRFDEQPYLPVALDRLLQETRRDRAEFGFSQLRLVVAFLRWHNLKETPEERITTPLLWIPVELTRRKGVRDQYLIQCDDGEAEFNPVLRHQLRRLYDIRLPETVDLRKTSIADIHADLFAQIRRTEPAVELRLVDKAQVRLVRQKALQRLQQFQRRRITKRLTRELYADLPDYSYDRSDYRPLGQALFERWVRPSPLPQRFEAGAAPIAGPRHARMVADAEDAEKLGYALQEPESHQYEWDVDLTQVTLANLNYKKMSLVRDYTQLIEEPAPNPAFDRVFSIEPRDVDAAPPPTLAFHERWNVIAADATQNAAVALARTQRSFIIQGPPGTGKSQTITNLIADYAGRGKRVLFVCEKRAALDVVFHRLKQSGLGDLCCLIHDSQADKKAFIADLRACYERWIAQAHRIDELSAQRTQLLAELDRHRQRIDRFERSMAEVPEALGTSLRQLIRRLAAMPAAPIISPAARERLPSLAVWDRNRELTLRIHRGMRERFGSQGLAGHPFARLSAALVANEHAFGQAEQLIERCEQQLARLDGAVEDAGRLLDGEMTLATAVTLAREAKWLVDRQLAGHLALLDGASPRSDELRRIREERDQRVSTLQKTMAATGQWRDKFGTADTRAALDLATRLENSVLRWLQPSWWQLRGEMNRRYDFHGHAVRPAYTTVLRALADEHAAAQALEEADASHRQRFGVADMAAFLSGLEELQQRVQASEPSRRLIDHLGRAADPVGSARAEAATLDVLEALAQQVEQGLRLGPDARLSDVGELLRDLRESLDDLPDLVPWLRAVNEADASYAAAILELPHAPGELEALVAEEALRRLEREAPELARFDGVALARTARAIHQGQQRLLAINAQVVGATLHRQFTDHVRQSSLSASLLDAAGKEFKKVYATGRRELEHEFSKSMRYRSIRDLADDETGVVLNDLKPIWLMSPLSVSDTLPLSTDLFDVVIFDEASQIPTEEAVPALSRARQVVVVGDEMQLPPTSFFSAADEDEDEIVVEEEGERIAINLDSDSLLNQAARNLPATLLAWHYRSRHESLISFSNAAFYDGRLVTIPDRKLENGTDGIRPLRSDEQGVGAAGADALMRRSVSFHAVADGVYEGRRNAPEARYIAQMVRELLTRETGFSIGIVAFSEAQQAEIEAALEALGAEDSDFAARLEREYVREDEDQFNGLFVKNLENVQGDERDVIILSICYAPGRDGKMLMNFGPINQRGGEKRLNVIFSRARHRMAVVSTIQAEAITNVHNDGAAALRAFLQFAQASARGEFERAQAVLGALNPGAREAFTGSAGADRIREAIASAMRERGHVVHEHVGRSKFRCDLAVADPDGDGYALGILLDSPDAPPQDTMERYVFRPGILRSFGWRVIDVPGRDWLSDPQAVLSRIIAALSGVVEPEDEPMAFDSLPGVLEPGPGEPPPARTSGASEPGPVASADATARRFRFEQGTSRKFWRIALAGAELTVTFGRIGSTGQSNVKTFETVDRAMREMEKLVSEKLRKGYVEDRPESE